MGYRYKKPVKIVFNLGTLEDICNEAQIEFYEVGDYLSKNGADFSRLLLYYGYLSGCKYDRSRPRYTMNNAAYWVNNITAIEQAKIFTLIKDMFDTIKHTSESMNKKKV